MPVPRILPAVLLLGNMSLPAMAAEASQHGACLTRAEQRAALDD
ncbi:MAG: hypothetical protein WAN49_18510 [Pseudolabrys sp.]